jgi:hypothetical protein
MKKLDFLGVLVNGMGFAIEVKQRREGSRFPLTLFDKQDNQGMDQAGHLDCLYNAGAYPAVWLQEIRGSSRGKDRAVLLLWCLWKGFRASPPMRMFENPELESVPYKSFLLEDVIDRWPHSEMHYVKIRGRGGRWYSHYEYLQGCVASCLFAGMQHGPEYEGEDWTVE